MSEMSISTKRLKEILKLIRSTRICVFGDFYLDRYSIGVIECISREAPIPIVRLKTKDSNRYIPGAAGNVAVNLADLGANVSVIGIIGNDTFGKELKRIFREKDINSERLLVANDRLTGAFEKFYASAYHSRIQQVARVDTESAKNISSTQETKLIDFFEQEVSDADGFIFADYAEIPGTGVITEKVLEHVTGVARNIEKIFVGDSRLRIEEFKNMICVPNDYEAAMAARIYESHSSHEIDDETVVRAGQILTEQINRELFITRGEKGIAVFDRSGKMTMKTTILVDGEIDPTGAGDTVAVAIAASLSVKATFEEAAEIANIAGRVTVGKIGTTGTASPSEILACHEILQIKGFSDQ